MVGLNFDSVTETRQIYTIWDFLGEVGGLMDMLKLIGQPLISLIHIIFGSGLSRLLFRSLFMVQCKNSKNDLLLHLKHRKPLKIRICSWLIDKKNFTKSKRA